MGNLRIVDRRHESRTLVDLPLTVWGIDTKGERFLQEARAYDISLNGALLTGIDAHLSSGDVIGILYAGKKARFRVIWIRYDASGDKMQAAIHRIVPDACPWRELLAADSESENKAVDDASASPS